MSQDMKAAVVFAIGLSNNPINRFERLVSQKLQGGVFSPAVTVRVTGDNGTPGEATIPLLCLDSLNEKTFEELRAMFHKRIDTTFDNYKKSWQERHTTEANNNESCQESQESDESQEQPS
jgi:hypothetical protein